MIWGKSISFQPKNCSFQRDKNNIFCFQSIQLSWQAGLLRLAALASWKRLEDIMRSSEKSWRKVPRWVCSVVFQPIANCREWWIRSNHRSSRLSSGSELIWRVNIYKKSLFGYSFLTFNDNNVCHTDPSYQEVISHGDTLLIDTNPRLRLAYDEDTRTSTLTVSPAIFKPFKNEKLEKFTELRWF